MIKKTILFIILFTIILLTKLYNVIDIPVILLSVFFLMYILKYKIHIHPNTMIIMWILIFFTSYAGIISVLNGGVEFIWLLKFARTLILFFLIYVFYMYYSSIFNYDSFMLSVVWSIAIHSIIMYMGFTFPVFREYLYQFTGYIPRGPGWSRSPGLTISFNATAIVHVFGLWVLFNNLNFKPLYYRIIFMIIIIPSLFFLGRTMVYLGLVLIILKLLMNLKIKNIVILLIVGVIIVKSASYIFSYSTYDEETFIGQLRANISISINPIIKYNQEAGVNNYFKNNLQSHVYFSDKWYVLIFGNSFSGHISMSGGGGETNSDLGIINSINANGIIITFLMIMLYLWFIKLSKYRDWQSVFFLVSLSLIMNFKETGFFASHVTSLLFLVLFYQAFPQQTVRQEIKKNGT